jgi:hypothetical protein
MPTWLSLPLLALAALSALLPGAARAQAVIRPLGQAGSWSVVEQSPAVKSGPASCMIVNPAAAVGIRSLDGSIGLMVANAHWDLPKVLHGSMRLGIGAYSAAFPATRVSANTALAPIDAAALSSLLNAMTQGPSMTLTLFPGMPVRVRLDGFATLLPAFRRCAGLG